MDDALGIFKKLTIIPESESITDDIMRYNLVFSIQETTLYIQKIGHSKKTNRKKSHLKKGIGTGHFV